jgi:hypothetical protein
MLPSIVCRPEKTAVPFSHSQLWKLMILPKLVSSGKVRAPVNHLQPWKVMAPLLLNIVSAEKVRAAPSSPVQPLK